MTLKLGKKPARAGAVPLRFGQFFNSVDLPAPPVVFGRPDLLPNPGMFANDRVSDCVWADFAHQTMYWHALAGTPVPAFTNVAVLSDYSAQAGYVPGKPETDTGTDMGAAFTYWQQTGIVDAVGIRHKVDYSVALRIGDMDEIALAAYLFGAVSLGIEMPASAMDQFNEATPWRLVTGSPKEGGHDVTVIGRNRAGNFLIFTWGRLHAVVPGFFAAVMDEGAVSFSDESLNAKAVGFRGIDAAGLLAASKQL